MEQSDENGLKKFTWTDLQLLTDNFSESNFIGDTNFGEAYRGRTPQGQEVTVKTWIENKEAWRTKEDNLSRFKDEIRFLTHSAAKDHPNVVKLIGYFEGEDGKDDVFAAVYDLRPKETLYNLTQKDDFTWIERLEVALAFARLLEFLHAQEPPYVVRNLDAAQVMLDQDFIPVLFDFSMVTQEKYIYEKNLLSIPSIYFHGYCDPSVYLSGYWRQPNDIFSYGAILMGLISKRVCNEEMYRRDEDNLIVQWANKQYSILKLISDSCWVGCSLVHQSFIEQTGFDAWSGVKITALAMNCMSRMSFMPRPSMTDIIQSLEDCLSVGKYRLNEITFNEAAGNVAELSSLRLNKFSWQDLQLLTNGFSNETYIGKTRCSKVYRGRTKQGEELTVKIWHSKSEPGRLKRENASKFDVEIFFLSHPSFRHQRSLVKLMGYCKDAADNLLGVVYNLRSKDTMNKLIESDEFTWFHRVKAAFVIAQELAFLHGWKPPYLVRSIDARHIMLDQDYNPIIFDFSLLTGGALGDKLQDCGRPLLGYDNHSDPALTKSDSWCEKTDVFSFGILLLRLICKRMSDLSDESYFLHKWAKKEYKRRTSKFKSCSCYKQSLCSLVHDSLMEDPGFDEQVGAEVSKLALRCVDRDMSKRPAMTDIVKSLQTHLAN